MRRLQIQSRKFELEELLEELEKDQRPIDHLGDYHIVSIIKWKLKAGLETKIKVGSLFANDGEDFENLKIEEEDG